MPDANKTMKRTYSGTYKAIIGLAGLLILSIAIAPRLSARQSEPVDGHWSLGETDCLIRESNWKISESTEVYRSAPLATRVDMNCGFGTKILLTSPVTPSHMIAELRPSVWVNGHRDGLQLYARVVLPATSDPNEEGPMTVLLPGPVSGRSTHWQKLDFAELSATLPDLLEQAVWRLRARYKVPVDISGAYVDSLVLNVYTGPGAATVWIDDIELSGSVPVHQAPSQDSGPLQPAGNKAREYSVRPVSWNQVDASQDRRPSLTACNSNVLEVRGQPFFVRMIQHRGEPFEMLRQLGFNTIELEEPATFQQLQQAERLDMWIVCPPPNSLTSNPVGPDFDRVLAWTLDSRRWLNDLDPLKTTAQELRSADFRDGRPLVAFSATHMRDLARIADIIGTGLEPIGGSFVLSQYSDWLRQRTTLAGRNMPFWADVQTEIPRAIGQHSSAIAMTIPPLPIELAQMRFMAYEAIASGARGLRFTSRSRLDAGDPVALLRRTTLQWLNTHLRHLEPWVSGGSVVNREKSNDGSRELTTLATQQARLVLVQRTSHQEQWTAGDAPIEPFRFTDATMGTSQQPYHLSGNGLMLLDSGRSIAGSEITIEDCGSLEAVLITDDPRVINRIAETWLVAGDQSLVELYRDITRQWLVIGQLINEQLARMGQGNATASGLLNDANNSLLQAGSLLGNGSSMSAWRSLLQADQQLAAARREILQNTRGRFNSSVASPLLSHLSLVPVHFDLASRIDPVRWQPNGLAGGEFEDLGQMMASDWQNNRASIEELETHVELSRSSPVRGKSSLLMKVNPVAGKADEGIVDRPALWIRSAKVPVRAGQLVRIHGWVNISQPLRGTTEGLRIVDSIGGLDLAERITMTRNGWQEFTLYRCPADDTELTITFEMTGVGQAMIDEVEVNLLDLPGSSTASLNATRNPPPAGQVPAQNAGSPR
jgi:hypothetical protein